MKKLDPVTTLRIPKPILAKLRAMAKAQDTSVSHLIRRAIRRMTAAAK